MKRLLLWILYYCSSLAMTRASSNKFFGFAFPTSPPKDLKIYWNVPTFMCHKYGLSFEEVSREFGILQNAKDEFRGEQIAILYDPGTFPALLKDANGNLMKRNGGVPQEGNLTRHLEKFVEDLTTQIPDKQFQGIAVIDFESWRPIFRQNWASLAPYRDLSINLVRQEHPFWDKRAIEKEAVSVFEKYGKIFMEETLKTAKNLRPYASWGYYAYPYCFNQTPNQKNARCDPKVLGENDRMSWLFGNESLLLPSTYLRMELSHTDRMGLIRGRIHEASRISRRVANKPRIFPYFWYKYQDRRDTLLSREDVEDGIKEIAKAGADGFIIWGSSNDLNDRSKCQKFHTYVKDVLGSSIRSYRNSRVQFDEVDQEDNGMTPSDNIFSTNELAVDEDTTNNFPDLLFHLEDADLQNGTLVANQEEN